MSSHATIGFSPRLWLVDIVAGLLAGLVTLALAGSYSLLIFNGILSPYAAWGVALALISAVVLGSWMVLNGSFPDQVSIPQDRIAPILGFMSVALVTAMSGYAKTEEIFSTLVVSIALSTLITGLIVYGLGRFQLGNLIRFIPYPVIGGFLAGSGWLLVSGSIRVATGIELSWANLAPLLFQGGIAAWAVVAWFGIGLFLLQKQLKHWSILPLFLALNVGGFYLWLVSQGITIHEARNTGWLIPVLSGENLHWPGVLEIIQQTDWLRVLQLGGAFTAVSLTSAVSILLNSSAIDLETSRETDLNKELRTIGVGNLIAGLGGGMVGFTSLSMSRLVREAGGRSRLVGMAMVAVCLVCLAGNLGVVGYLPKFVLGGLLLYLGLLFLHEWLYLAWWKLPRTDYAAVVVILSVIATSGYLQGVMVGLLIATLLFVVNYSRVRIITHTLTGLEQRSNVDRSPEEQVLLRTYGRQIHILRLQGFIFFGSASGLLAQVRERLEGSETSRVRFIVLDFARVYGIDSSAVLSLRKLRDLVISTKSALILCGVSPRILEQMERSGFETADDTHIFIHQDRDHALEWCEDRLLGEHRLSANGTTHVADLFERLALNWPEGEVRPEQLKPYLEPLEIPSRQWLIRQGEGSHELFFLEKGRLTAVLEGGGSGNVRLRTMNPGAVVGELGLYLGEPRTASIMAESDCTIYRLKKSSLEEIQKNQPALASAFHQCMLRMVASRLVATSRTLQMVLE